MTLCNRSRYPTPRRQSNLTISILLASFLTACGGGKESASAIQNTATAFVTAPFIEFTEDVPSTNPFIHFISLKGDGVGMVRTIDITIHPKPQAVAKPTTISYSATYLESNGYANHALGTIVIPVFGLYQNYTNAVDITVEFNNSTRSARTIEIPTTTYVDPNGVNYIPQVIKSPDGASSLGYSYFYTKSWYGSPVVFDIDGEMRWIAPGIQNSYSTIYSANKFWIGNSASPILYSQELDGRITRRDLTSTGYTNFHHNIDFGKYGFFVEVDSASGSISNIESVLSEVDDTGEVLAEWDFAKIIANTMLSGGDDPSQFVRPGIDWFHMNAAVYVNADDSIIVSSRENFVIKIDYQTGRVKWIFGDPQKYWYTFPSLRSKSLTLYGGGLYPIGQHSVTINADGDLLLFNDGAASFNQPVDAPRGVSRSYSAVSAYHVDDSTLQAFETMSFENGRAILSDICSSVDAATDNSMLITYSVGDFGYKSGNLTPRIMGVYQDGSVAFEYKFTDTRACGFSWNSSLINFEHIAFR